MNIGQAAACSGVSAKMVRHYEALGLLPRVARTESGYRQYSATEVHTLRFIRRARELGFSMAEIGDLLKLWQNRRRASADVKRIAQQHMADLDRRIAEMSGMRRALEQLVHCCHGDGRPECPILDGLAELEPAPAPGPRTPSRVRASPAPGAAATAATADTAATAATAAAPGAPGAPGATGATACGAAAGAARRAPRPPRAPPRRR